MPLGAQPHIVARKKTKNSQLSQQRQWMKELNAAIRRVETKNGKRLVDHLVEQAFKDKQILLAVAKKILPDLKHIEGHQQTETDITISWDSGTGEPVKLPGLEDDPSLIEHGEVALIEPPEPLPTVDISSLSRDAVIKKLAKAEKDGQLSVVQAIVQQLSDASDESGEDDDG